MKVDKLTAKQISDNVVKRFSSVECCTLCNSVTGQLSAQCR